MELCSLRTWLALSALTLCLLCTCDAAVSEAGAFRSHTSAYMQCRAQCRFHCTLKKQAVPPSIARCARAWWRTADAMKATKSAATTESRPCSALTSNVCACFTAGVTQRSGAAPRVLIAQMHAPRPRRACAHDQASCLKLTFGRQAAVKRPKRGGRVKHDVAW